MCVCVCIISNTQQSSLALTFTDSHTHFCLHGHLVLGWETCVSSPAELALGPELETYLASKASVNTPAASGAAADVPECLRVQLPYKSVVAWRGRE